MDKDQLLSWQAQYLQGTYSATLPLVKGQGSRLWDADGKRYLDFGTGISVCNLGHCHPAVTAAICEQAGKLVHVSNLYVNERQPELAKVLSEAGFGGRLFFANSGAEANECLIKFARKWGSGQGRHEIVVMRHSFHGRTLGTLAATDKPAIRAGFEPELAGFRFADLNDLDSVADALTEQTAAVLLEPVQMEGGVYPSTPAFLRGLRQLCDERGVLLLFDEVQTGMGRSGHFYAYQHYGIEPDALSLAKALGNGFPIGAAMIQRRHEAVLGPGSHASTFGGTPLACAAALAVARTLLEDGVLANVQRQSAKLFAALADLATGNPRMQQVRGLGLMIGIELSEPAGPVQQRLAEQGLLALTAGEKILRLLPPLTLSDEECQEGLDLLARNLGA